MKTKEAEPTTYNEALGGPEIKEAAPLVQVGPKNPMEMLAAMVSAGYKADELGKIAGALDFSPHSLLAQVGDLVRVAVVTHHRKTVVGQVENQVAAHHSQADQAEVILCARLFHG